MRLWRRLAEGLGSVIGILIDAGARYELSCRDIAHVILIRKIESGFNPDIVAGATSVSGL